MGSLAGSYKRTARATGSGETHALQRPAAGAVRSASHARAKRVACACGARGLALGQRRLPSV